VPDWFIFVTLLHFSPLANVVLLYLFLFVEPFASSSRMNEELQWCCLPEINMHVNYCQIENKNMQKHIAAARRRHDGAGTERSDRSASERNKVERSARRRAKRRGETVMQASSHLPRSVALCAALERCARLSEAGFDFDVALAIGVIAAGFAANAKRRRKAKSRKARVRY
jgi:hypothetical protein